jgi:aldose 1-epimerase
MNASTSETKFGQMPDGTAVDLYTLTNANGLVVKVTNLGTIITELHVPDRKGALGDVVLGFDNLAQYVKGHPCFGCTVGRVANRIAKGRFTLDGKTYTLVINNGPNHLHGGNKGFDKKVWKGEAQAGAAVKFTCTSPDGEEGYPGTVVASVTMTLTDANELRLDYRATTDRATPINLTNHSYFNLAGHGDVLRHELMIAADNYTPFDSTQIPTGEIKPVKGTPFDFTTPHAIGARFSQLRTTPPGYDHNFVLNGGGKGLVLAARLFEPESGRVMEVLTTEPGMQLYTANHLNGSLIGKGGIAYPQYGGACFETEHFPDSINQPAFPSVILRPDQIYRQTTVFKFSAR